MEGIIYKVLDYQEKNKLLYLITKNGKKTLVAKNSQTLNSQDRILSQYLTKIKFEDNNKTMQTLKGASLIDSYEEIKKNYSKIKYISVMLEIIDRFTGYENNFDKIYQMLDKALKSANLREVSLAFIAKMLYELGYGFNLTKSSKEEIKGLNLVTSSLVFIDDSEPVTLNLYYTNLLLKLLYETFDKMEVLNEVDYDKLLRFIKDYYSYHIQPLKNI
ncbi:MAG: DNA repair protein RecO [Acholeplasmataceae bacterium]|nr:DNA repair protein RecO [Acholeplasmataceae bacterium]